MHPNITQIETDTHTKSYEYLAKHLKGHYVIDACCGYGIGTSILAMESYLVIGTEADDNRVSTCRQIHPHLQFELWDIETPCPVRNEEESEDFYRSYFDSIVCLDLLKRTTNPLDAICSFLDFGVHAVWIHDDEEFSSSLPNHYKVTHCNKPLIKIEQHGNSTA